MPDPDITEFLEGKSRDDLETIIAEAEYRLSELIKEERKEITRQIAELADSAGLKVILQEKAAPGRKPKQKKTQYPPTTRPPKYRNPDNPEETWHGRGPRPGWMADLIEAGRNQEEFLINS